MSDDTSTTPDAPTDDVASAGNTATHGDHDRVAMLSLRADGSPDQLNPEFIGDPDATLAATTEQFKQQAVSAADVAARTVPPTEVVDAVQDPTVAELTEVHEQAADAAEKAAQAAVAALTDPSAGQRADAADSGSEKA